MPPILFNLYGEYLMKKALAGVGRINKATFADDMVFITKTQKELNRPHGNEST